jgi:hypothetical protein
MEMFMSVLLEGTRIRVVRGEKMAPFRWNDNPAARKMIASALEEVGLPADASRARPVLRFIRGDAASLTAGRDG